MSVSLSPLGNAIVVGYIDDPDGSMRVKIASPAHPNLHVHVDDEATKERVRDEWDHGMGHVFTTVSNEALCLCPPAEVTS